MKSYALTVDYDSFWTATTALAIRVCFRCTDVCEYLRVCITQALKMYTSIPPLYLPPTSVRTRYPPVKRIRATLGPLKNVFVIRSMSTRRTIFKNEFQIFFFLVFTFIKTFSTTRHCLLILNILNVNSNVFWILRIKIRFCKISR